MASAVHTVHDHRLTDGCEACYEAAARPASNLDTELLANAVGLASLRGERFNVIGVNEAELLAAKHCLDALETVGRMLEANPKAVLRYFREAWKIVLVRAL